MGGQTPAINLRAVWAVLDDFDGPATERPGQPGENGGDDAAVGAVANHRSASPVPGGIVDDLRERIAQAIEAEADPHVVGDYGMGHNAATYQAAQIARNTP